MGRRINTKKWDLLIFLIITLNCLAQEHEELATFNFEEDKKYTQSNIQESNDSLKDIISISVFARIPGVIIYNLNREEFFITPCL